MTEIVKMNETALGKYFTFTEDDDGNCYLYIGKEPVVLKFGNEEFSIDNSELFLAYESLLLM